MIRNVLILSCALSLAAAPAFAGKKEVRNPGVKLKQTYGIESVEIMNTPTGIVIDSKFYVIDLEWDKPFGERISTFDINNDGIPEVIGEFSDYSLRIFDVHAQREVW